jgi:hypothetical protein
MRTSFFVPVILVNVFAGISLTAPSTLAQHAADECISRPGPAAPEGSHWYFRVNRSDHRHCWYVGPAGATVHASVRAAEPLTPPGPISRVPIPTERPANAKPGIDALAAFAMRWPDIQGSRGPIAREPSSVSGDHAEPIAVEYEDEMPLIWPILTSADRALASSSPRSLTRSEYMLGLLAGALVFAAMIAGTLFKPFAAGRLGRFGVRDQHGPGAPLAALSQPDTRLLIRQAAQMRANAAPISAARQATAGRSRIALRRGA